MKLLEYYHKENIFVVKIMRQKSQKNCCCEEKNEKNKNIKLLLKINDFFIF